MSRIYSTQHTYWRSSHECPVNVVSYVLEKCREVSFAEVVEDLRDLALVGIFGIRLARSV